MVPPSSIPVPDEARGCSVGVRRDGPALAGLDDHEALAVEDELEGLAGTAADQGARTRRTPYAGREGGRPGDRRLDVGVGGGAPSTSRTTGVPCEVIASVPVPVKVVLKMPPAIIDAPSTRLMSQVSVGSKARTTSRSTRGSGYEANVAVVAYLLKTGARLHGEQEGPHGGGRLAGLRHRRGRRRSWRTGATTT